MSKLSTSRARIKAVRLFALTAQTAAVLALGGHGLAATPMEPKPAQELASLQARGTFPDIPAPAASQVNLLEIAGYLKNDSLSKEGTDAFSKILDGYQGWISTMDCTEDTYVTLRHKCLGNNLWCDIVLVDELHSGPEMNLAITIYSTPASHRKFHAQNPGIDEKSPNCNTQHLSEDGCRDSLLKWLAVKLEGLDTLHKAHIGDQ